MDVELLARIQFAFTVAFHYIYPPLSIGIGLLMVIFESLYVKTKKEDIDEEDEVPKFIEKKIKSA